MVGLDLEKAPKVASPGDDKVVMTALTGRLASIVKELESRLKSADKAELSPNWLIADNPVYLASRVNSCSFFSSPQVQARDKGVPGRLKHKRIDQPTTDIGSLKGELALALSKISPALKLNREQCQVAVKSPGSFDSEASHKFVKNLDYSRNMKSHVTFLSTPTVDTNGTSLLLHFDDKRYLIGSVHEGMQRVCVQEGARLSRVTDVWITGRTTWGNIGGIFGMILTLADVLQSSVQAAMEAMQKTRKHLADQTERSQKKGDQEPKDGEEGSLARFEKPTLTLHGGLNLMQTLATARKFIFRKSLPIVVNEHGRGSTVDDNWKPTWMDQNICVWAMAITPEESSPDSKGPKKRDISPRSLLNKDSEEDLETSSSSKVRRVPAEPDAGDVTEEERSRVLKGIISDMFDSDWRLDALFETPLAEVRMPATIFIRDAKTNKLERYQGPMPGGSAPVPDVQVLVRRPWPGALVTKLPRTAPSATSMSYIFRNHPQRGKFNPKAAISLGVVPGPSFRQLTLGNSVLNKQGETVLPEQVLGKGKPGGGFAVIDLPSIEYIAGLISRPEWNAQEVMVGVEAVVWKLGPGVGKDVRLQEFVQKLHGFKHVISSPDYCANYLSMDSASAAAVRHNQIDPDRFDVPIHDNRVKALPEALSHCTIAHRGIQIELEPEVVVRVSPVPILLNTAKVISEMPNHVKKAASAARSKVCSKAVQADHQKQDLPGLDVELIPLGTGSALPSKYRNVSSTLMRVPGIGSYLFDCGENTMGQLSRLYPPKELRKVLRDLKMIWISHMHADHHLGTTSVIKAWYEEVHGDASGPKTATDPEGTPTNFNFIKFIKEQKRLFIVGEASMSQWLKEYSKVEDFGYQRLAVLESRGGTSEHPSLLHWNTTPVGFNTNNRSLSEALQAATGLSSLATVYVTHCNGAQAISMTFPNGFKVSYSGDCRPSKAFAEIGKGSTVLIHEATFDDELRGDAFAKNHSTTSEAIGVGYSMGARRILLTHFSQRYQKMPKLDAINNFVVRFDDSPKKANEQLAKHSEIDLDKPALETEALDNPSRKMRGQAYDNSRDQSLSLASLSRNAKDTKVAIAFDLMRIKVRDIGLQEIFSPAFVNLYEKSILADDPVPSPDFDQLSPKQKEEQKKKRQERDKAKKVEQELFMRLRKEHKSMASNDAEGKPMQDKKGPEIGANEFTTRADEQVSQNLPAPKEATGSSSPATSPSQQTRGEKRKERRLGGGSAQDLSSSSEEDLLYENKRKKTLKQERRKAKKAQIQEPQSRHEREDSPRIMGSDIRGYIVE